MKRFNLAAVVFVSVFSIGLIAGLVTGIHFPHHTKSAVASSSSTHTSAESTPSPQPTTSAASTVASSWAPSGYVVSSVNGNFAINNKVNPDCQGDSSLGKACWTFQMVSKFNCSSVSGDLDMDNSGSVIATVTGSTSNVRAGRPFVLEIDSGAENDSEVDNSTNGTLTALSCSR
jgi:hypothetical protein